MRQCPDQHEVEKLAKTMEVKFTVSGPTISKAKSGINFDPQGPCKRSILARWFKAVIPLLKTYHGTGSDLNVDGAHGGSCPSPKTMTFGTRRRAW